MNSRLIVNAVGGEGGRYVDLTFILEGNIVSYINAMRRVGGSSVLG